MSAPAAHKFATFARSIAACKGRRCRCIWTAARSTVSEENDPAIGVGRDRVARRAGRLRLGQDGRLLLRRTTAFRGGRVVCRYDGGRWRG